MCQGLGEFFEGAFALGEEGVAAEEAVDHAGVVGVLDGDAGLGEARGVGEGFVAEGVVAGGDDEGGGEVGEAGGEEGRGVGVEAVGGGRDVLIPVPLHGCAGEHAAFGVFEVGWGVEVGVGGGIEEELEGERRAAAIEEAAGDDGGEGGARAVAADGEAGGVDAEGRGVGGDPEGGGLGVFDGGGEGIFGGESIIDGGDGDSGGVGDGAAEVVVGGEAADDPAAAVEIDERWEWAIAFRVGEANAEGAGGAWEGLVVDALDLGGAAEHEGADFTLGPGLMQ